MPTGSWRSPFSAIIRRGGNLQTLGINVGVLHEHQVKPCEDEFRACNDPTFKSPLVVANGKTPSIDKTLKALSKQRLMLPKQRFMLPKQRFMLPTTAEAVTTNELSDTERRLFCT